MGLSIEAVHDDVPLGTRRPMRLVLRCDAPHDHEVKQTFGGDLDGTLDDWCREARAASWQLRVGDDAMTLCRSCRRDWGGRPTVKEQPRQLRLFPA